MEFIGKIVLSIISGIVGAAIKGWIEDRRLFPLRKEREVYGDWRGTLTYFESAGSVEKLRMRF
jgi:hypothetical protein